MHTDGAGGLIMARFAENYVWGIDAAPFTDQIELHHFFTVNLDVHRKALNLKSIIYLLREGF
jgi:hypothetical protein